MARILNDVDIRKLFGVVMLDADEDSLRPNGYILRLGKEGRFINTEKDFRIGSKREDAQGIKMGIEVDPGHAVGITSLERIDFSEDAVGQFFPGCSLHGFLSPTTDLSREGMGAPTTQIDAGFKGTLNWTITNHSHKRAKFLYGEKVFRLTLFVLNKDEKPDILYSGDYQGQYGYVPSQRPGPTSGIIDEDWAVAIEGEDVGDREFESLRQASFPWGHFARKLQHMVTPEMLDARLEKLEKKSDRLEDQFGKIAERLGDRIGRLEDALSGMRYSTIYVASALVGAYIAIQGSEDIGDWLRSVLENYGVLIGWVAIIFGVAGLLVPIYRRFRSK